MLFDICVTIYYCNLTYQIINNAQCLKLEVVYLFNNNIINNLANKI